VIWYADHPGCVMLVFLPANWATQRRTSVYVEALGGGWISETRWLGAGNNSATVIIGGGGLPDQLLAAGWAYVIVCWPYGWVADNLRYFPNSRHPHLQRYMQRAIQKLKTMAAATRAAENITGDPAHSLAFEDDYYVVSGNSSAADNWGWGVLQHDGAIPYWTSESAAHAFEPQQLRYSHRVRAAVLNDAMTDFRLFDPDAGVSDDLIRLFGHPRRFQASAPLIKDIPPEILRDASILPFVEADHLANRRVAICAIGAGTLGNGWIMGDPGITADEFRELAEPRTPIIGLNDVHEQGTLILLEDALKVNTLREGKTWAQAEHRIVWGNGTNNPNGLHLIDPNLGFATLNDFIFDWLTNVLGIPPYRD
jgi:hypothetical protein